MVHGVQNSRPDLENSLRSGLVEGNTLVDWLLERYPEIKNVGDEPELRPGIVHRLDKDTSGVMVIAKNQEAFEFLKEQFKKRKIKKTYIALVQGDVKQKTGVIDIPIGRSKKSPLARLASLKAKGKLREAVTEYKVIKKFSVAEANYTLLEAYPKTGRTHQIRAHLKAIGHPIVGDKLYSKNASCLPKLQRQFLHAASLELNLPSVSRIKLEADLPKDLQETLNSLENLS